jgi:hypothetical protein
VGAAQPVELMPLRYQGFLGPAVCMEVEAVPMAAPQERVGVVLRALKASSS